MSPEISVLVMTYNEVESLEDTVESIIAALQGILPDNEIVIIDDGSTDGSSELADEISEKFDMVKVVHHAGNKGLGEVYRTGLAEARGKYITFFSADGQFPSNIIPKFYEEIKDCDMVLGYIDNSGRGIIARCLSGVERSLYSILFGGFPRFQGIMMARRSLFSNMKLISRGRGWGIVMEFIIKAKRSGAKIKSVITDFRPRTAGKSKVVNLSTIKANLVQVFELRNNIK